VQDGLLSTVAGLGSFLGAAGDQRGWLAQSGSPKLLLLCTAATTAATAATATPAYACFTTTTAAVTTGAASRPYACFTARGLCGLEEKVQFGQSVSQPVSQVGKPSGWAAGVLTPTGALVTSYLKDERKQWPSGLAGYSRRESSS